ncbi:glucose 1-dehydrogenase [Nocardia asiatica]|uniref:glucose 1-dehydrogenase n=1 Tax=Nocardia asiatica TaxID=209252 RepID=UPI003EE16936
MPAPLEGKVALITGSGAGIGAAIASRFATEGARVVVSDRNREAAEATAAHIPGAIAIMADVTREKDVASLIQQTAAEFGGLHLMVANAGVIGSSHPIVDTPLETWRSTMAVNLDGVFLSIRHAAPAIINSGGGSITTISSISGTGGTPLVAAYGASKAAVRSLTATAAGELHAYGVRVNALLPGFADTTLVASEVSTWESSLGLPSGGFGHLIDRKQGRLVQPDDIASAAVFLASDQAELITGSALVIDGGFTSQLF